MYISEHVVHIGQQLTTVGRTRVRINLRFLSFSLSLFFSTATIYMRVCSREHREYIYKTMHKGSSVGLVRPFVHLHRCS